MITQILDKKSIALYKEKELLDMRIKEHFNKNFWLKYIKKNYSSIKGFKLEFDRAENSYCIKFKIANLLNMFSINDNYMNYRYYVESHKLNTCSELRMYFDNPQTKSNIDKYFSLIQKRIKENENAI